MIQIFIADFSSYANGWIEKKWTGDKGADKEDADTLLPTAALQRSAVTSNWKMDSPMITATWHWNAKFGKKIMFFRLKKWEGVILFWCEKPF